MAPLDIDKISNNIYVTAKAIVRYAWATVVLSGLGVLVLPEGGLLYGILLLPFNARLMQMVNRLVASPEDLTSAKGLFRWSILYMFGICLLLVFSRQPIAVQFDIQGIALISKLISSLPVL